MVQEQGRTLPRLVVIGGLTLTLLIALLQQRSAVTERGLLFDAASARLQQGVVDRLDLEITEFTSGNNFIAATHPGPIEEYKAFFRSEGTLVSSEDPGPIFIEVVGVDEIDGLVERERNLGNEDFAVTLLPGSDDQRTVLTRLANEVKIFNFPLLGLDATTLRSQLLPEAFDPDHFGVTVVASDDLAAFISPTQQQRAPEYGEFVQFLTSGIAGDSGQFLGYAVKFQPVSSLYANFSEREWQDVSMELFVSGIDEPIGGQRSLNAPNPANAELFSTRTIETASLEWQITVWGDDDFGGSTGLFLDQLVVWLAGFGLTAAGYLAAVRRRRQRQRLDKAQFELAHARTLAQTDALTGLLNRNGLIDAARQVELREPATVFFIDLDGFKSVNDTEGHDRGDQVLRAVATELRSIFRSDDLVGRIGGDEFVVFTRTGDDDRYVAAASKRITEAVSGIDERVTCSLGVASRTAVQRTDVKTLIREADAAMYEAKRLGGNRFSVRKPA